MNLEEIMKPYFDKKEELERINDGVQEMNAEIVLRNNAIDERIANQTMLVNQLKLRIERLNDNKESEINEYIQSVMLENQNFSFGYGALIRADLEKEYEIKETKLKEELRQAENLLEEIKLTEKEDLVSTNNKYYRVDVRELVSVKEDIRKKLIAARKNIEIQLKEVQINSDIIMLKLTRFESVYDENHNVINGDERRKLFEESNNLVEVRYNLEKQLEKIKEYLNITEITKEEAAILMMSLTPWEKEEYDRRKAAVAEKKEVPVVVEETNDLAEKSTEEIVEVTEDANDLTEKSTEEVVEATEDANDLTKKGNVPAVVEATEIVPEEEQIEDGVTLVDSFESLINEIYGDILLAAKKTRAIALNGKEDRFLTTLDENDENYQYGGELDEDNMQMPNGNYINKRDIFKALDRYRKQNKGRVFKVKGYDKTFEINRKTVRILKKHLRECSTIKLVREKKIGHFDLKRVYGKVGAEKYIKLASDVETKMATGKYINQQELIYSLGDLFAEKSPSWFEKFKNKLRRKNKTKEIEINEYDQNQLEWDDDYIIKTK